MSQAKRRRLDGARAKREPGSFVPIPHVILRSQDYANLSAHAVKLLFDLLTQYQGNNNGNLCATWSLMRKRGWRSRDTLQKALQELLRNGWIQQTRQGGMHCASLYGVTFYALDPNPKLEVSPNSFDRGAWARGRLQDWAQANRNRQHAQRVNRTPINTPSGTIGCQVTTNQHAERVDARDLR
jgi:hypothetical protein